MSKKVKTIYFGKIENGKVIYKNEEAVKEAVRKLEGREIEATINKRQNKRTLGQNSLYWVYLKLIADETGNDIIGMHVRFKKKYLPIKCLMVMSDKVELLTSTTELDTKEFSDYLKKIEVETGILLPSIENIEFAIDVGE